MKTTTIYATTALFLASLSSAQLTGPNMPATVVFVPYKLQNCSMTDDITVDDLPSAFAVTSGRCYNSTYAFNSYFGATNFGNHTPCAMSVYTQVGCQGENVGVDPQMEAACSNETMTLTGMSFKLACGP